MASFVLISGAWHAGWCWERVVPLLSAAGHRAIAPDLIGMGPDAARLGEASVAAWAAQIADIVSAEPELVVLVGHSRGGVVISEVAELVPDRIARLVYVAAFLLPDGRSIAAEIEADGADTAAMLAPGGRGGLKVRHELAAGMFYNTSPPEWAEHAVARLTAEPAGSLVHAVRVTAERFGRVPRGYVECLRDQAVPIALQRRMQAVWPCEKLVTLDTDHSPFYSAPDDFAAALEEMAIAGGKRV